MNARLFAKNSIRRMLPRTAKAHKVLAGPLKGCRLHTSWYDYPGALLGTTERPLLEWFGRNVAPGQVWLDVGAHYGYVSLALCRLVGADGHVFAFEPVASTAESVAKTKELNGLSNLTIVPYALGNHQGVDHQVLSLVRGMADSTVHRANASCEIAVTSLDWLWPSIAPQSMRVHGVKIDVQGMEIETLQGMRTLLAAHQPQLVIEPHDEVDRVMLLDEIQAVGYDRRFTAINPLLSSDIMVSDQSYAFLPQSKSHPPELAR